MTPSPETAGGDEALAVSHSGEPVIAAVAANDDEADGHATRHRSTLDRALTRGIAWMGMAKWITQLATWVSTIIVARLLSPADYGIVGLATMFLGIVTMASEFGIDAAVVTMRTLPPEILRQLNAVSAMLGFASFILACSAAPLLARFFETPELLWVVVAMSTSFLVLGFRVVPQALLLRGLRFRGLAFAEGGQALVLAAAMVLFAWLGFRYWTLVIGAIIGSALSTVFVLAQSRCGFARPRWNELRAALTFSRHTIVARLSWYGYDNADFFVAGKLLGKDALGAYNLAWQFASTIIEKVTSLIGRVTPAVLSAAQHDPALLRRYLLAVTEAISLVTAPATVGISLVAGDLVPLLLGEKWMAAVTPLRLLALYAAIRSVTPFLAQVLTVTGETRQLMRINVFALVVLPFAFVAGSRWGLAGIAAAWIVAHPLFVVYPAGRAVFRRLGIGWREYGRALAPAGSGVLVLTMMVLTARLLRPPSVAHAGPLVIDVAVGMVAYTGTLLLLHRNRVQRLWEFLRSNIRPVAAT